MWGLGGVCGHRAAVGPKSRFGLSDRALDLVALQAKGCLLGGGRTLTLGQLELVAGQCESLSQENQSYALGGLVTLRVWTPSRGR